MLQKVTLKTGQVGWRWGDDGKVYTGSEGKRMALREGAELDPRAFASLQGKYEVIADGEDVEWNSKESGGEIIHLD